MATGNISFTARAAALTALLAASACIGPAAVETNVEAEREQLFAAETARQVRRCYRAPRVASIGREIVTQIRARYGPDGALVGLPLVVAQRGITPMNQSYASSMAEAARLAVIRCTPVRAPPDLDDMPWTELELVFSPRRRA